jgi:hypothetical protein
MKTPEQTRADCAALEARVMAQFDAIDAYMARIYAQMKADGLVREPSNRTRAGDPQQVAA